MREGALSEILDAIDMESYLDREGVQYKRTTGSSGPQLNVKECPVCGNNNWKTYLGAETGLGNCFRCETKFNKFTFVRAQMGDPGNGKVVEHLRTLAMELGWRAPRARVAVEIEVDDLRLPESLPLPHEGQNLDYLERRGIGMELTTYFNLRYSDAGVFWYRSGKDVRYQSYAKRVIIPVFDLDGELVSFQGRDITGTAERKYLFPPGFASTGRYLYNGHNARRAETIVVGEGAFDVIAIKAALDEEPTLRSVVSVGTFGKHLSVGGDNDQLGQLLTLKREGLRNVVFMWDGERAALADAARAARHVLGIGLTARIAILPPGKDPNEVSPLAVRQAYYGALPATNANIVRILMNKVSHA